MVAPDASSGLGSEQNSPCALKCLDILLDIIQKRTLAKQECKIEQMNWIIDLLRETVHLFL